MNFSLLKKILIPIIFIAVLGYFGYTMFVASPNPSLTVVEPVKTSNGMTSEQVMALIGKLKSLSSDQAIFSSEAFMRLRDFSSSLQPEPQGRPNPFLPIGAENSGQTAQAGAAGTKTR